MEWMHRARHGEVAYIGLGSNLGQRAENLRQALQLLSRSGTTPTAVSGLYETGPWGCDPQPDYLNAVVEARWPGSARDCLALLLEVERQMGRVRTGRNQPRIIDLDLLFFGQQIVSEAGLSVPHPRLHLRRFVLVPLCELAPHLSHPVLGRSVSHLLSDCPDSATVRYIGPFTPQWPQPRSAPAQG